MKIALWQTAPLHDIDGAIAALETAAAQAKSHGAEIILTPEMVIGGYNVGADRCRDLAAFEDDITRRLVTIARTYGIAIVAGLALGGGDKPYNGAIAIDAAGNVVQRYHKTHLFGDVDQAQFAQGSALSPVFEMSGWRIGLAICYDIEFPEVARHLALAGADLILVPTANMIPYDTVATRLVPARAEENATYVAYANYVGQEGAFTYGGLSCVCGPDGNDLARGTSDTPDILIATLSHIQIATQRDAQRHLVDRRPELYQSSHIKGLARE